MIKKGDIITISQWQDAGDALAHCVGRACTALVMARYISPAHRRAGLFFGRRSPARRVLRPVKWAFLALSGDIRWGGPSLLMPNQNKADHDPERERPQLRHHRQDR